MRCIPYRAPETGLEDRFDPCWLRTLTATAHSLSRTVSLGGSPSAPGTPLLPMQATKESLEHCSVAFLRPHTCPGLVRDRHLSSYTCALIAMDKPRERRRGVWGELGQQDSPRRRHCTLCTEPLDPREHPARSGEGMT